VPTHHARRLFQFSSLFCLRNHYVTMFLRRRKFTCARTSCSLMCWPLSFYDVILATVLYFSQFYCYSSLLLALFCLTLNHSFVRSVYSRAASYHLYIHTKYCFFVSHAQTLHLMILLLIYLLRVTHYNSLLSEKRRFKKFNKKLFFFFHTYYWSLFVVDHTTLPNLFFSLCLCFLKASKTPRRYCSNLCVPNSVIVTKRTASLIELVLHSLSLSVFTFSMAIMLSRREHRTALLCILFCVFGADSCLLNDRPHK